MSGFVMHLVYASIAIVALSNFNLAAKTDDFRTEICRIPSVRHAETLSGDCAEVWPWQTFKTSRLQPPALDIIRKPGALALGSLFFAPYGSVPHSGVRQSANWIMTDDNDLVLGLETPDCKDFRVQTYNGTPHITYWTGRDSEGSSAGHGYGRLVLLDGGYVETTFNPSYPITTQFGPRERDIMDLHEHQLTSRGSLLTLVYENVPVDLSGLGGPVDGWVVNSRVVEFDILSGKVLFDWDPMEHVPLNASKQAFRGADPRFEGNGTRQAPWDWIHINSIQDLDDMLLINARHTWTVYSVDRGGHIHWSLTGDTGGDFAPLPPESSFRWQHEARGRRADDGTLTLSMFDNHNVGIADGDTPTRGLVFGLSLPPSGPPTLLHRTEAVCAPLYAHSQGSFQTNLDNGNFFQGYGAVPIMREYSGAAFGDFSWEARFGHNSSVQSYRAFKQHWSGTPRDWDPVLTLEDGFGYVSWNGATDVDSYSVFAGEASTDLHRKGCFPRQGFETQFPIDAPYVQVEAVRHGIGIRLSNVASSR